MKRFARFVNLFFYRTVVFDVPTCSFLITVSLGRRTIATAARLGKG